MKKTTLAIAILAAIAVRSVASAMTTNPGPALAIDGCDGEVCEADYVVFPNAGWTISAGLVSDGESNAVNSCDTCRKCSCLVTFSYSGTDIWRVNLDGEEGEVGNTSGWSTPETGCDAIPSEQKFITFDASGNETSASGSLFCLCTV